MLVLGILENKPIASFDAPKGPPIGYPTGAFESKLKARPVTPPWLTFVSI